MISRAGGLEELEILFDDTQSPGGGVLPLELARTYGGNLAFDDRVVYANLVTTIDGVAAVRGRARSSQDVSAGDPGDRFVMGLLRAHADAVVIGAGTLRAHPLGAWTAERAYPPAAGDFAAMRAAAGRAPRPRLAVVTARGEVPHHPALEGAIVLSTEDGASHLDDYVTNRAEVQVVPDGDRGVDVACVIDRLRSVGHARVLTEGGPKLVASLLAVGAVDDLFLTVSPVIAGRAGDDRPGIVDGFAFPVGGFRKVVLSSARRGGSFLFLRYQLSY